MKVPFQLHFISYHSVPLHFPLLLQRLSGESLMVLDIFFNLKYILNIM